MPVLIRHHGAQHRAAVVNSDRRPGFRRPAQGQRRIIGQPAAGQRPGVLRHIIRHLQVADRRHGGVHREHKVRRVAAGVPRHIGHRGAEAVLPLAQRIRSEAPVPVLIRHRGAQHRAAVVNSDRRPGFRRPAQGRRRIIGQPAAGQRPGVLRHIIRHLQVADRRHGGVHREHKVRRVAAGVPRHIGHRGAEAVLPLAQRIRSEAPVPVLIRHRGAQHRAAVVNSDRRPGFRRPAQGRRRIIGQPAAGQRPGVLRHIIRHLQIADRRHGGVHREHKVRRVAAGVPRHIGHRGAEAVLPLAQRIRSEAPVSVLIRHRGAQHRAAVVNSDRRPGFRRPAQDRRRIIGQPAAGQRPGVLRHIIRHLQVADRRHGGVHREHKVRRVAAGMTFRIRYGGAK
uniref:Uncharacterized protein n=1 Tax=Klebsiella pneumoniae TaxID=573 RepID=A0A486PMZ1_KLEPN|nr:Uncharacterised protein [Klebsiella pneumoniae]